MMMIISGTDAPCILLQASSVFAADDITAVTHEFRESSSSTQQSSPDTMHSDQMETVLQARARNNLHFILCIRQVRPTVDYK